MLFLRGLSFWSLGMDCDRRGRFMFFRDQIDSEADWKAYEAILEKLAGFAQFEREIIGERRWGRSLVPAGRGSVLTHSHSNFEKTFCLPEAVSTRFMFCRAGNLAGQ
jgi:hypothetical protein